jgi:hypothetical protein
MTWKNARAGSIGGTETYLRHGSDHMKEIGKLGGRPSWRESLDKLKAEEARRND